MKLYPIEQVTINPSNPRIIKDAKFKSLVTSLKEFPEMADVRPLVCNLEMVILGGNMRYQAMKEAGWKEVPVIVVDWTEERQREFIIKDNANFGDWDWDVLADEWDQDQLEDWGIDIPAFIREEPEAQEDDYDIPEGLQTDIVLGDLFEIGPHKLICGDTKEADVLKKLFGEQLADLVVTDPPYNVDYTGGTKKKLKIENDKQEDHTFYQFLYDAFTAIGSYTKPGGAYYVWYASRETINFHKALQEAGILCKQDLIWVKNAMVMGRSDYQWRHEPCIYGWKDGASHGWYSDRKQTTILEFERPTRNAEHPTMKPVPLIAYLITNSSKQGDIVADTFAGSGTTLIACHQLNRKAYLAEIDPVYCQVIINRIINFDPAVEIKRNGVKYQI